MSKSVLILLIYLFGHQSFASDCDERFEKLRPKIDELRQVVLCDPSFTIKECQENLGLKAGVGVAVAAGTAVGFKSGRQMILKKPAFCGYKGASNIWKSILIEDAHAACENPFSNHMNELDAILSNDETLRRYQLGLELEARVKKDYPELVSANLEVKNARDVIRAGDPKKIGEIKKAFKDKYGFWAGDLDASACEGPIEICKRFGVIHYSSMSSSDPVGARLMHFERVADEYANDPEIKAKIESLQRVQATRTKIKTLPVKTDQQLARLFEEGSRTISDPFKSSMAAAAGRAGQTFPNMKEFGELSGNLKKSFGTYVAEGGLAKLAKAGLPALVAGLLPLAAKAADCSNVGQVCAKAKESIDLIGKAADELDPDKLLGAKSLGCSGITSTYSTIGEDCNEVVAFTPNLKTFLLADGDLQQSEVCRSRRFENVLSDLHTNTFGNYSRVSCGSNSVTLMDDRLKRNVKFDFNGDQIVKAQVIGQFEDHYGYDLDFSTSGTLTGTKIKTQSGGRTFLYYDEKKIKNNAKVDAVLEDFSTRIPVALSKWNDCKNGNIPSSSGGAGGSAAAGSR